MILAMDVGGTNLRAALVDGDGHVAVRDECATPDDRECGALIELGRHVLEQGDAERAVIGVPGRVDYRTGVLEYAPNLPPTWPAALTEARLADALGIEVALANDADLAAVGEAWFGAGRNHDDVAYLTISTGIGAGVVTGGLLVHGRRSVAEVGHTIVDGRALLETPEALSSYTEVVRFGRGGAQEWPRTQRRER
jgi:glucokinase